MYSRYNPFLSMVSKYSSYGDITFCFISLSAGEHLGCFHFLAIGIMLLFTFVYTFLCDYIFISVTCIPGNGISRSHGLSV